MPNTNSAKKALRSSLKKRGFNNFRKNQIKTSLKDFRRALATDSTKAQELMSKAFSSLDKAVKTNLIHRKRADRKKSRLSKMLSSLSTKQD